MLSPLIPGKSGGVVRVLAVQKHLIDRNEREVQNSIHRPSLEILVSDASMTT